MNQTCEAFQKNPDGSWTSIQAVTINGPQGEVQIMPIMTFFPGEPYNGVDVATWLDQQCPGAKTVRDRVADLTMTADPAG
jgi:hypothetical protein